MIHAILENKSARRAGKLLLATALVATLAACASAADPISMTTFVAPTAKPFPQQLHTAMCVRTVSGGEKTNPMWTSQVDDAGFRSALSASLTNAGLLATGASCGYQVDANLLGLSQPIAGFSMTVTSHVNYKVYDPSGQPFLLATIDAPFTAKVSDAFVGMVRLKLANEGSIRVSIDQFFDKLRDTQPK
jgi:hypothetical protein